MLTGFLIPINIYQYLAVTDKYLINFYITKAIFHQLWSRFKQLLQTCNSKADYCLNRDWYGIYNPLNSAEMLCPNKPQDKQDSKNNKFYK